MGAGGSLRSACMGLPSQRGIMYKVVVWQRSFFGATIFRCYPIGSGWLDLGREWQLTQQNTADAAWHESHCIMNGHVQATMATAMNKLWPCRNTVFRCRKKNITEGLRVQKYEPKFVLVRRLTIKHKGNSWRDLPLLLSRFQDFCRLGCNPFESSLHLYLALCKVIS